MRSSELLSEQLKKDTQSLHEAASHHEFNRHLMSEHQFDKNEYISFLWQLLHIYQALETRLDKETQASTIPAAAAEFKKYARSEAIQHDLDALNAKEKPPQSEATDKLTQDIASCTTDELLAHAYVRIFADLSGGQIIGRNLNSKHHLESHQMHFYDYTSVFALPSNEGADNAKKSLRESINRAISPSQHSQAIAAAKSDYQSNIKIMNDVIRSIRPK